MTLQQTFVSLVRNYSENDRLAEQLWFEIEKAYTHKKRHYHTLTHLDNLLEQLTEFKNIIADWDALLFSLFYHDIVYNVLKQDNEEESARIAVERMSSINVPGDRMNNCRQQILATKAHELSSDPDTNLFTDADLSILGADWDNYSNYIKQIRKEYVIYPEIVYKPGRKKVLMHFLAMERIYKTSQFMDRYEQTARKNMSRELTML